MLAKKLEFLRIWRAVEGVKPAQRYRAGTELFGQASAVNETYLIEDGLIRLVRFGDRGQEVTVALRFPGWVLGAASVILRLPSPVTAITATECRLRPIPARLLLRLIETNVAISRYLLEMLSREVYEQIDRTIQLSQCTAQQRLEQLLWDLISQTESIETSRGIRLQFPLKQEEIAQLIAVTPSYLSRMLKRLEQQGLIQRRMGWIVVSDPQRLWHQEVPGL